MYTCAASVFINKKGEYQYQKEKRNQYLDQSQMKELGKTTISKEKNQRYRRKPKQMYKLK